MGHLVEQSSNAPSGARPQADELSRAQVEDFENRRREVLGFLDGAFAPNRVAQALVQAGLTPADLATATGANVRTVASWLDRPEPGPRKELHRRRLRELKEVTRFIVENGTIAYQEADWLRDPNRSADFDTPLELIAKGEWQRAGRAFCDDVAAKIPSVFREGKG